MVKFQKTKTGHQIRIPEPIKRELNWSDGAQLELVVVKRKLVIRERQY